MTTVDTQFSTREVPWMKLGKLEETPKTAAEAMALAKLDFTVSKQPAGYLGTDGKWHRSDHRVAVVRDDTGDAYEFVSPDYELFQYSEAFDFMDTIDPNIVAAGSLKGGRQAFMVVQPDHSSFTVGGDDSHDLYAILRTSHDRSRAIEVTLMALRHKCMNQLTLRSFSRDAKYRWSIPHTRSAREKLIQAQQVMVQLDAYTTEFQHLAERLMRSRPEEDTVRSILAKHVTPWAKKQDEVLDIILHLWHENEEQVGFNDTSWGVVSAVSEYFDWGRSRGTPESRFLNALQGVTHNTINRVTKELLELTA